MERKKSYSSVGIFITALVGLLIGAIGGWFFHEAKERRSYQVALLEDVMDLVETHYVDTLDMTALATGLIPDLLRSLDPHSEYIPREESLKETQRLEGVFFGVGISFNKIIDTPVVVDVMKDGPAFRAGIEPGDRLLSADGKSLLIDTLSSEGVQKLLQGVRGSVVNIDLLRNDTPLMVGVTRDEVPIHSVDVAYMLDDSVGLIRISNTWARNTHQDFISAYAELKKEGLKALIVDLRDNVGGYLQSAVQVANEFLPEGSLIVYSQGRAFPREEYRANGSGLMQELPLVVLVNELSASSSEIFAGAMQDLDRAMIVGRRTFGKGLVQQPFYLPDSAQIRLTVARYYIPSGRSIQKKYKLGEKEEYRKDLSLRYGAGELFHADSAFYVSAPRFTTNGGRIVYGENGIMPDIFIPADSVGASPYYFRLLESGLMTEFAFRYADQHRAALKEYPSPLALWEGIKKRDNVVFQFIDFAAKRGIPKRPGMLQETIPLLDKVLSAQIAQYVFGFEGFYQIFYSDDPSFPAARSALEKK